MYFIYNIREINKMEDISTCIYNKKIGKKTETKHFPLDFPLS